MPNYKLTYFNGRGRAGTRGRAEVTRILFEVSGTKYEDNRIEDADWPEQTPDTLFNQLPTLEVDGKVVSQYKAFSRYIARELGLYGSTSWEALEIDVICEHCADLVTPLVELTFSGHDDEKKKELYKKYYDEKAPKILGFLNTLLCHNKEGSGFFVGDKISLADVVFLCIMEWVLSPEHPDAVDAFPKLKALLERIKSNENIATYLKKRPVIPW